MIVVMLKQKLVGSLKIRHEEASGLHRVKENKMLLTGNRDLN